VVEIISPGSRGTDRGDKFFEYEAGGVREYWLIDPDRKQAEFYRLGDDKLYHLTPADADGRYHAREIPGLWIRVEWFWQSPLPPVLGILREWKLI
jgi:Uma2 family endonuclease